MLNNMPSGAKKHHENTEPESRLRAKTFIFSDAPIWNLADIPKTDNGSEISANTDSQSDIQLCSNF